MNLSPFALPKEARDNLKIWRAITPRPEQDATLLQLDIGRLYFGQILNGVYPPSAKLAMGFVHLGMIRIDDLLDWYPLDVSDDDEN